MLKKMTEKSLTINNLGRKYLVEDCVRVKVEDLLQSYRHSFKALFLASELQIAGWSTNLTTSQTYRKGTRIWLKCPICERRIGVLFKHPLNSKLGCRICLDLDYRKRRYKGMIENEFANNFRK